MGTDSHRRRTSTASGDVDPGASTEQPSPIRQALRAARRGRHVNPTNQDPLQPESPADTPNFAQESEELREPRRDDVFGRPDDPASYEPTIDEPRVDGFELTIEDFGTAWSTTVQGWVVDERGHTVWRPIVTTTGDVPNWVVDTTLGVVTGEAALDLDVGSIRELLVERGGRRTVEQRVHRDRVAAHQAMVEAAVARGAHAVVGVSVGYTPLGEVVLVTATGTAVTLRAPEYG